MRKAHTNSGSAAIQYLFAVLGVFVCLLNVFYCKLLLGIADSNPSLKEHKIRAENFIILSIYPVDLLKADLFSKVLNC